MNDTPAKAGNRDGAEFGLRVKFAPYGASHVYNGSLSVYDVDYIMFDVPIYI